MKTKHQGVDGARPGALSGKPSLFSLKSAAGNNITASSPGVEFANTVGLGAGAGPQHGLLQV